MPRPPVIGKHIEAERKRYDALPVVQRCALCPDWIFRGTAAEGRTAAQKHRSELHPELSYTRRRKKRKGEGLNTWIRVQPQADQMAEADLARAKRMRLLGLDIDAAEA